MLVNDAAFPNTAKERGDLRVFRATNGGCRVHDVVELREDWTIHSKI